MDEERFFFVLVQASSRKQKFNLTYRDLKMLQKNKAEKLKQLIATGEIAGWKIVIDRMPRIVFQTGANKYTFNPKGDHHNRDTHSIFCTHIKDKLTFSDLSEGVVYVVADRVSQQTEERRLNIPLHEYGRDEYTGTLEAPLLTNHIKKLTDKPDTSAEALVGIESEVKARLVFNITNSVASDDPVFDRFYKGKLVEIKLSSNTGEWKAVKTDLARASYALLADMKSYDIDDQELINLILENAPSVV